jgi:SWI/SNF-related matrix-associated actin-dependent regulator of chromatin subfamily A member 5
MQSISILVYMMEFKSDNGPHLIIVPKSTLSNWMNELERWGPTLNAVKFHGNKDERLEIATKVLQPGQRDELRKWNVCVTTYEICNLDRNVFNKFAWSYLVIDEAHRLKNEASIFSQTVRTLETKFRLLLTGTPLQNNLHELWALLNYLVPDVFASSEQFDEWFNLDIDDASEKNKLISQLHKILRPFMLRRLKADVEKSLPPKSETILFTGMSAMQKKLYKDILMRDLDTLTGKGGGSRTAVLNIVMQLRKCAGHPYLFPGVEDRSLDPLGEHLVENCGKMVLLDKLLIRLKERGHRVLLFTQMTRILDIMEDYMHMRGFQYCRIDGNTTYDDREERIDAYNKPDSEKFLFLLSTRAGGLGINLQTADVVILYDSDWNPQADLQAQDRAHRIGQKRPVQVFRLVTEDTIEQKVVERAQQKLKLDAMVVQQGRLKDKDKLSADELLNAIRFGADKIFKSKDSSITDDDIELILDYGMKKTQELNEKFSSANKGDMLDFKLDGGLSAQTFEGIDYSEAKNAQFAEEFLSCIDVGKRERRTVAYNENQLYMQQMKQHGTQPKKVVKKEIKLPRMLRLPKMEEWQLFDRDALHKLQELEEQAFRALPEDVQMFMGGMKSSKSNNEAKNPSTDDAVQGDTPKIADSEQNSEFVGILKQDMDSQANKITHKSLPPLLRDDQIEEKARLLAEGFADWSRYHFAAFVKASAKYGRSDYTKIANDVGKPVSAIKTYSEAFWDQNFGKKRFTEHEYDRVVKNIEKGEKKIDDIKGLQRGTKVLLSLFDNPWWELQFTHVNTKDKKFTSEEDRYLLCWAHKVG